MIIHRTITIKIKINHQHQPHHFRCVYSMQRAASSQELRQQFREQPEEEKKINSKTRLREMQRVHHDYDQHQQEEHRITIMSTTPMEVIIMIFTSTIQTRLLRNVRTVNSNRLAPSASRSATLTTTTIQSPHCSWATTTRHQRHHHVRPLPDSPPTTARLAISTRRRRSAIRVAPTTPSNSPTSAKTN